MGTLLRTNGQSSIKRVQLGYLLLSTFSTICCVGPMVSGNTALNDIDRVDSADEMSQRMG